jgi:hypothetical protein
MQGTYAIHYNIRMDLKETYCDNEDWIQLALDRS